MSAVCVAFAIAAELSLRAFSATAALTGAATFALMRLIAARSGSSSPASSRSSSGVSLRYSDIQASLVALVDGRLLSGVRVGDGAVGQDVRRHGGVDRDGDVRVHERHRGPLGQLLAGEVVELLAGQGAVVALLGHALS